MEMTRKYELEWIESRPPVVAPRSRPHQHVVGRLPLHLVQSRGRSSTDVRERDDITRLALDEHERAASSGQRLSSLLPQAKRHEPLAPA